MSEERIRALEAENKALAEVATNAAAMLGAVFQWLDMVNEAGGATSISGVAKCNAMLKSLNGNRGRADKLIIGPLRTILAARKEPAIHD